MDGRVHRDVLFLMQQGQADELSRLQGNLDDSQAKGNILQKRVEEREQRLRKIEAENVGFLFHHPTLAPTIPSPTKRDFDFQ